MIQSSLSVSNHAFIALGSNLASPLQQLDMASLALGANTSIKCVAMSPVYQSKPHGIVEQPDFINAVMEITTTLTPLALLDVLQVIENQQGRERSVRWGARTLDLDLILYEHLILKTKRLVLPHPHAHQREFVIKPLYDLDETLTIPEQGCVAELIKRLPLENLTKIRHGKVY